LTNFFYIIADDATGANDSGVQFAKRGYPTTVYFDTDNLSVGCQDGITVIDSDTRGVSPAEAYQRVLNIVRDLPVPPNYLFKKVDSTLRGNIGAEIRAVLDQKQGSIAFIVPAYPSNGRTTRNGTQYLHGRPVHETEIGRDPKTPVCTSRIADLLQVPCYVIGIDSVEKGQAALKDLVQEACNKGYRHIIFDAETDQHLKIIAVLHEQFSQAVWVGCAGIAQFLSPNIPITEMAKKPVLGPKPLLFITGSLSASTYEQVLAFTGPNVYKVFLEPLTVLTATELNLVPDEAIKQYSEGKHLVIALRADADARQQAEGFAREEGISLTEVSNRLRHALGNIAGTLVDTLQPPGLFVSGGDTARSIFEQLGIRGIRIIDELETGIPIGKALERDLYLITKAGAFGTKRSFHHIIEILYRELPYE
jgi:uncharacterized protein YgbK (DUF1537 family)